MLTRITISENILCLDWRPPTQGPEQPGGGDDRHGGGHQLVGGPLQAVPQAQGTGMGPKAL